MGELIQMDARIPPSVRVTLCALALAVEYYTHIEPDPLFVMEARAAIRIHDDNLHCRVSKELAHRVVHKMPLDDAVKRLLYAQ